VSASNPAAEAQGILPGLPLADARAQLPGLNIAPADLGGDAASLLRLAQWCGRYSPWTAPHGPDSILLDIAGCAHLAGGEDKLGAELVARLARRGFTGRIGIADTIGGAWAMAREGGRPVAAIAPGEVRATLAALPMRALRLDEDVLAALRRLGLNRIGDLYVLPRAALAARFDGVLIERLNEALGEGSEALSPLPPAPSRWTRCRFAEPIATAESIAAAVRLLLAALCRLLADEALGVRLLVLTLHRVDGESASIAVGTARPSRDAGHLWRLFEDRLREIDPGLGIEDMVLIAKMVGKLTPAQLALPALPPCASSSLAEDRATAASDELATLVDRLANRLGPRAVGRFQPHESHMPERAQRFLPVFPPPPPRSWDAAITRPVRLLPRPEPIEATAPVPDDPPILFRWRRRVHHVKRADGPERILGEWWRGAREAQLLRDYYRVEDELGRRFWVFRSGLYRPETRPRWFLHGLCP